MGVDLVDVGSAGWSTGPGFWSGGGGAGGVVEV